MLKNKVFSIPNRVEAVLRAHGGNTKYLIIKIPSTKEAAFTYAITSAGVALALSAACARGAACPAAAAILVTEAAFTYAITSAGVALALSAACARGGLPGCGCHPGAAFTYAITSAGVALALSAACARGGLPGCGCHPGNRRRSPSSASERFQWGGCADTAYGLRVARRLLDARELEADARSAVNLHNNRVGRKMVKDLVRLECKCHGVSGSCALKTCWRALPNFKTVATALKEKYMRAKMVARHPSPVAGHALVVVRRSRTPLLGRQPRKSELVYLQRSPSYCEPDEANGVYGTRGRHCSNKSRGENSCEKLCCGRGYNTLRHSVTTQCNCTFVWCCKVVCDRCTNETELFICK
ncbi:unnamed protein product [Plutella xylostella]|uniref:Protein Wnt n=1 Tax=Plutella xylostella TaxID=51655 RepID=A0A8S4G685_PLUXY|nr:unnamed protein product [Plutella xylostella]